MNVFVQYKSSTSQNFRTIIDLKNLDVCPIMKSLHLFPAFRGYHLWMDKSFPGMVHPCPYKDFMIINASHYKATNEELKIIQIHANGLNICKLTSLYFIFL
jgi:hypothetical protein